jgi:HEAT repeat protein
LLPYVQHAEGPVREILGRVLGEVANAAMAFDLMQFLGDDLDELRAAAARAMSNVQPGLAFDSLSQLAEDPIWFVRLRAIVSLGKISNARAVPVLLRGLTDSNRLVRLRAAESLIQLRSTIGLAVIEQSAGGAPKTVNEIERRGLLSVFEQVAALKDRYGLHAYMTALENANLRGKLEEEIRQNPYLRLEAKNMLLEVLETGRPPVEAVVAENAPVET